VFVDKLVRLFLKPGLPPIGVDQQVLDHGLRGRGVIIRMQHTHRVVGSDDRAVRIFEIEVHLEYERRISEPVSRERRFELLGSLVTWA
jgi:hypothetical protein